MILIKVKDSGIYMKGHAGRKENGVDLACAAVSALTCNLINSLKHLTTSRIRAETASGNTMIIFEKLDESGKTLVDSWYLGMLAVNQEYNCMKIE